MTSYLLLTFVLICLAVAAFSVTMSAARVSAPLRNWLLMREGEYPKLLGLLLSCPYCISHYVAVGVVLLINYRVPVTGHPVAIFFITMFAVVGMSCLIVGAMMRLQLWHENENRRLREALHMQRVHTYEPGTAEYTLHKTLSEQFGLPVPNNYSIAQLAGYASVSLHNMSDQVTMMHRVKK